jgi:hypothetical protein
MVTALAGNVIALVLGSTANAVKKKMNGVQKSGQRAL